jgi:NtrC-family two-component system sensor histidine kinase KinB
MKARDRFVIACLGLLVLLLLMAIVSLSLTSSREPAMAEARVRGAPIIISSTRIQVQLSKLTTEAGFIRGPAAGHLEFEGELAATGAAVTALCKALESTPESKRADTLGRQWTELEHAIRSVQGLDDAEARVELHSRIVIPAEAGIRTTLSGIVDTALSDMESEALQSRDRLRNGQRALLSIELLGIAICVGFLAILGTLLRKPSQALVQMIDSVTMSSRLETPTATPEEVGAVVAAIERLLAHVRDTGRTDLMMLLQAERRAEHAMDCIPDALALANRSGEILYSNKTMDALIGKRPERLSDLPWIPLQKIIHASMTSATPQAHANFDRAIQVFLEGSEKFYLPGAHPLVSKEGAVEEIVVLMNDVTYLKQLDEMKVDLVATVSHQLKTPLTSIRMSLHMLNAGRASSLTHYDMELVSTALGESERLHETIQNLLDMARTQSGAIKMNFEPVDSSIWFSQIGGSYHEMLAEYGIGLSVDIASSLPSLLLDTHRMAAVIENLMTNAAKHCRRGDKVRLQAATESVDKSVITLSISDTGPGIEASQVTRIFEPFYQGSARRKGGTGLGLTIARKIIQAHGGEMICRSAVGEGTKFIITLYSDLL